MSNNSTKYDSIATIALDLSKNYIQIHAEDAGRRQVMNRRFGTSEARKFLLKLHPCEVGMEACATAHSWGRLLQKHGMTVHLIPGQYVKPYVTRSKTDALDARAVAEAMRRSDLTFVPVKSEPQQALQTVHKTREALVTQRTATINAVRAHCAEFGVYTAVGRSGFNKLVTLVEDADFFDWPAPLVKSLKIQIDQVHELDEQILELEKELEAHARGCEDCQRLLAIGGVGVLTATAVVSVVGDVSRFRNGRQLAAYLGLTPKEHSTGGRQRLGAISKRGTSYVRRLLIQGQWSAYRKYRRDPESVPAVMRRMLKRGSSKQKAVVAAANHTARVIWAVLHYQEKYRADHISVPRSAVTMSAASTARPTR